MKAKITYARLQERVAAAAGIPKKEAQTLLGEMTAAIGAGLVADGKVNLAGLGRFNRKVQPARRGRNPQTGEPLDIPEKNRVDFLPEASWRRSVNREFEAIPVLPQPLPEPPAPPAVLKTEPSREADPSRPANPEQPTPPVAAETPTPAALKTEPPREAGPSRRANPENPTPPVETETVTPAAPPPVSPAADAGDAPPVVQPDRNRRHKLAPTIGIILVVAAALFFLWPRSQAPESPAGPRPIPIKASVGKRPGPPETSKPEPRQPAPAQNAATAESPGMVAVAAAAQTAAPAAAPGRPVSLSSYAVTPGDSLWKIAGTVYHYPYYWPVIYQKNHTSLQHPDSLIVGLQLAIPAFEGRFGQLTESDFEQLADGYLQVYRAYQRHKHPQAPYYLWVAYRLRAHWVPESELMLGEPEDLKFIRQLKGRGLIH